jgi:ABC-type nitrate/sulfonate/bicarbonate transport system substrate-binding protein
MSPFPAGALLRRLLPAAVLAAILAPSVRAGAPEPSAAGEDGAVRVGFKNNTSYQIIFVAEAKGFFDRHGVRIVKQDFESTELMLQAVAVDRLDATVAASLEAIAGIERKSPGLIKLYLTRVFDQENALFTLLVPVASPIRTLADLRGKRIGVVPGGTGAAKLRYVLSRFFNPAEVTLLQLKPQLHLQALSSGEVDAVHTVDPYAAIGPVKGGARVLIRGAENRYMFTPQAQGAAVISSSFLGRRPETSRRFIRAMNETVDFMAAHPAEVRAILGKALDLEPAVCDRLGLVGHWKIGQTDFGAVERYFEFAAREGIIPAAPASVRDLYVPESFLR